MQTQNAGFSASSFFLFLHLVSPHKNDLLRMVFFFLELCQLQVYTSVVSNSERGPSTRKACNHLNGCSVAKFDDCSEPYPSEESLACNTTFAKESGSSPIFSYLGSTSVCCCCVLVDAFEQGPHEIRALHDKADKKEPSTRNGWWEL